MVWYLKIFSRNLASERKQTKDGFYYLLKLAIDHGMAGFDEALEIKHRINDINQQEMVGVMVRSRFQENIEKERGSLYHLARDKKNNLEVLKIDGNNVTDQAKIQE